jgi:hypothetical protein
LDAQPIRLYQDNPRWFEWHGKATVLLTSAEHYGAVLNLDFDFRRYLEALQSDGMNYTRIFTGSYVEPRGALGIQRNTLAPMKGRFIAPWARSDKRRYTGGGHRFDLDRLNAEYLARLKDFIREAGRRGIVVELTLFCSVYSDRQWRVHPFNPVNNIQGIKVQDWKTLHTSANSPAIMDVQGKLVRWLVRELNEFDNLFYEIQNEPWADNHTMGNFINPYMTDQHRWPNAVEMTTPASVAWQRVMARTVSDEESRLPKKHLLAQNVANFRLAVREEDLVPEASIINFHYAYPEAVDWNRGLPRVIGCDETGCAGRDDATYRHQAWNFIFSGGALFNNLDYSFTVGHEDGQDLTNQAPGGGGPTLRRQLKVLSDFLHGLDLANMHPDSATVRRAPGVVVRGLSAPGRQYAFYLSGRGPASLQLNLPTGTYAVQWMIVETGRLFAQHALQVRNDFAELQSPEFKDAIALHVIHRS